MFDNFSGSPKALRTVLQKLLDRGIRVDLVTSATEGALSGLAGHPNLKLITYKYTFSGNKFLTSLRYLRAQAVTFFIALKYLSEKDTVFYINTILPVMPALAGRMTGKRVVYHYHENAYARGAFYRFLCGCMQHLASHIVCVSGYQRSFLKRKDRVSVVPNALPDNFVDKLKINTFDGCKRKNVLLVSSLKRYKGIDEFFRLAESLPQYSFTLVVGEEQSLITKWMADRNLHSPENLKVFACQKDVAPFYSGASVVLNLSNKEYIIETFGLTVLEALSFGLPVIVPTVGGVSELVEDGVNGYKIDVQNLDRISECISKILENKDLYEKLSRNALKVAEKYNAEEMADKIYSLLKNK